MSSPDVAFAAVAGAILGSFANVLIYRMPNNESIVTPRSRCPRCRTPIRAVDNIPVLSYLLLRGRCRRCGQPISARYPLVEILMALLAAAAWAALPDLASRVAAITLVFLLVVITFIDIDHQLILNRLSYPGIAAGLAFAAAQGRLVPAAASAVAAGGLIAAIVIASRGGMGEGDIKLAAMIGAFLGWPGVAVALFASFAVGGAVGIGLLALRLRRRRDAIPFGPALASGALIGLFWGDRIWTWYWGLGRFLP
jgi:leader peptidase (prepilin peptidase)/N-methyltransferase